MPFALVTVGLLMVITGVRNTYSDFASQLKSDFTGPANFTYWIVAIGVIGSIGYVDRLRAFANMFMALIILAMVLKNGGIFDKFKAALATGGTPPTAQPTPATQQGANDNFGTASKVATAVDLFAAIGA